MSRATSGRVNDDELQRGLNYTSQFILKKSLVLDASSVTTFSDDHQCAATSKS